MSAQQIVYYIGLASFALSAIMAVLSVYTYFTLDIRGVMDDLSGRRRATAQPIGRRIRSRSGFRGRGGSATVDRTVSTSADLDLQVIDEEDNVETVVDTALRPSAVSSSAVNSDKSTGNAYKNAAQSTYGTYHRNDIGLDAGEVEKTVVEGAGELATEVDESDFASAFRISRRIVFIHSDEVISVS